jgi:hypothetical protein
VIGYERRAEPENALNVDVPTHYPAQNSASAYGSAQSNAKLRILGTSSPSSRLERETNLAEASRQPVARID